MSVWNGVLELSIPNSDNNWYATPLKVSVDSQWSLCLYWLSAGEITISVWLNSIRTCCNRWWWSSICTFDARLSWTARHCSSHNSCKVFMHSCINVTNHLSSSYLHFIHLRKEVGKKPNHALLLPTRFILLITSAGTLSIWSHSASNSHSNRHKGIISSSSKGKILTCKRDIVSFLKAWDASCLHCRMCSRSSSLADMHILHWLVDTRPYLQSWCAVPVKFVKPLES